MWWWRGGHVVDLTAGVDADGVVDGIPLSSHVHAEKWADVTYVFPYKLYYNTFIVSEPKDQSVSIEMIGLFDNVTSLRPPADPEVKVPALYECAPHEVYNNIFVDETGKTPFPTYW